MEFKFRSQDCRCRKIPEAQRDSVIQPRVTSNELPGIAHFSICRLPESQRDSITQPRVARNGLPWVNAFNPSAYPNGVASKPHYYRCDPVGVEAHFVPFSQDSSFLATLGCTTPSLQDGSTAPTTFHS